jgi:D-alanyl-D-alanine carboxypeptidase
MFSTRTSIARTLMWAAVACAATGPGTRAGAEALLVIEAESGKVLFADKAGQPWYPASVTKLMTAYVTLRAVREGRLTLDKPITVSSNAAAQAPVKMGFPAGTLVTVDNALKMLMVKSANDMAVVLAEGVAGSVENFSDQMNANARRLGMTQSTFVNPNGLPADDQVSSARDLAMLARALIREMPEYDHYWHLPGIRMGKMVQRNYNTLIGRYPGADGMKTGFICASGFNLVASATRDDRRLIAVVLGAPSSAARAVKAAQLLERGFNSKGGLAWLLPSLGTVETLQPVNAAPPNLRDEMCGGHRKRPATEDEDEVIAANADPDSAYAVFLSSLRPPKTKDAALMQDGKIGEPVLVHTGVKPPAPGAAQAGWNEGKPKQAKKKTATKDASKDASKDAATPTAAAASPEGAAAPKPKPKTVPTAAATSEGTTAPKPKPKIKDAGKDDAAPTAAATSEGTAAPKPKPKKPAPKTTPEAAASPSQQTSQAR